MRKRTISAVIMLLIFIPILLLGNIYYTIFGSIIGLMGLYEIMKPEKEIPGYMKFISYFVVLYLILYNYKYLFFDSVYPMSVMIVIFFIYVCSIIINKDSKKYNFKEAVTLLFDVFLIGILFNSFIRIRLLGEKTVIYCFLISIMTDTFAYFGGSLLGKHKLIPSISPNKTIEGSITGSLFGTVLATGYYYLVIGHNNILEIIILSFILTIISQIGDLFFSSIKRYYKIKDYSNLIPGHGGVLDRLDSSLFVILGFILYLSIR